MVLPSTITCTPSPIARPSRTTNLPPGHRQHERNKLHLRCQLHSVSCITRFGCHQAHDDLWRCCRSYSPQSWYGVYRFFFAYARLLGFWTRSHRPPSKRHQVNVSKGKRGSSPPASTRIRRLHVRPASLPTTNVVRASAALFQRQLCKQQEPTR